MSEVKPEVKETNTGKDKPKKLTFEVLKRKRRLVINFILFFVVAVIYLTFALGRLYFAEKKIDNKWEHWQHYDTPENLAELERRSVNATHVTVGTYFENIRELNIKNSTFRVEMMVWFKWKGDPDLDMINHIRIYRGTINKFTVTEEYTNGDEHYQRGSLDVTINESFDTTRFPLGTYPLKVYIEPTYSIDRVRFYADGQSDINEALDLAGYSLMRYDTGIHYVVYETNYGNPSIKDGNIMNTELLTRLEIKRNGMGTYAKCFIALIGTLTWIFIVMFINTNHRVDPLSMIPAALFGTVTNITIGANMLPDTLGLGLLEFVNMWGVMTIIGGTITVINVNRIRNKWEDKDYATLYGRVMFAEILFFTLLGHILMPFMAYHF